MLTTRFPAFGDSIFDLVGSENTVPLKGLEMDMKETDDTFEALVNVPGVDKSDIDVNVEDNVLTVSIESHREKEKNEESEGHKYHWKERSYGKVSRSIKLPGHVDQEQIQATCNDGVLSIVLPKHKEEARKQKKIAIN